MDVLERQVGSQHIESGDFQVTLAGLIEVPHPLDQVDHFPCIHGPEACASQKRCRVADSVLTELVQQVGLRHVGFYGEDGESQLGGEKLQHAVSELEEFMRAAGGVAERRDAGIADHAFQRLHVGEVVAGLGGLEPDGARSDPLDNGFVVADSSLRQRSQQQQLSHHDARHFHPTAAGFGTQPCRRR